jgi:hypothetical protein
MPRVIVSEFELHDAILAIRRRRKMEPGRQAEMCWAGPANKDGKDVNFRIGHDAVTNKYIIATKQMPWWKRWLGIKL